MVSSYGYTQSFCHKPPRCIKCAKSHLTKDCDKRAEQKPKCCKELMKAHFRKEGNCRINAASIECDCELRIENSKIYSKYQ